MTSAMGKAMPMTTSSLPYSAEKVVAKASPLYASSGRKVGGKARKFNYYALRSRV